MCVLGIVYVLQEVAAVQLLLGKKLSFLPCTFTLTRTYQQVFKDLPSHIGFNIEVKYPVPETTDPQYNFSYFERNQMADIILKVVYRYAHKRKIIFSCFDPDMCTM